MTDAQLAKARRLRDALGLEHVEFVEGLIEDPPVEPGSVDVVISNGVVNLAPDKDAVFRAAARALRPGGRLAIADIVSERELIERTRRNVALWAACIAGAVPHDDYLGAIEAAGLQVGLVRGQRGLPLPLAARPAAAEQVRRGERDRGRHQAAGPADAVSRRTVVALLATLCAR